MQGCVNGVKDAGSHGNSTGGSKRKNNSRTVGGSRPETLSPSEKRAEKGIGGIADVFKVLSAY